MVQGEGTPPPPAHTHTYTPGHHLAPVLISRAGAAPVRQGLYARPGSYIPPSGWHDSSGMKYARNVAQQGSSVAGTRPVMPNYPPSLPPRDISVESLQVSWLMFHPRTPRGAFQEETSPPSQVHAKVNTQVPQVHPKVCGHGQGV